MSINFDAVYQHRRKRFRVLVGPPGWWQLLHAKVPADPVSVYRLAPTNGPQRWVMGSASFLATYELEQRS